MSVPRATGLLGLLLSSACYHTKLSPAGANVRETVNAETVRGCQSLGVVSTTSRQGGFFGKGVASSNVNTGMKNKVAELGGNVLLIAAASAGYGGGSGRGEAYKCATP